MQTGKSYLKRKTHTQNNNKEFYVLRIQSNTTIFHLVVQ